MWNCGLEDALRAYLAYLGEESEDRCDCGGWTNVEASILNGPSLIVVGMNLYHTSHCHADAL